MIERVNTEDRVWLHFDRNEPKVIVVTDPVLAELDWSPVLMPVVAVDEDVIEYESWHPILHVLMENECRGRMNDKPYRKKSGSVYGRMVKYGSKTSTELCGCYDTPLNDIDFLDIEDGVRVVALGEFKRKHERLTRSQRLVIDACRDAGIMYHEDEH